MSERMSPDPYTVLGVAPDATIAGITRAYRDLLRDPARRAAYDRQRRHREHDTQSAPTAARQGTRREPVIRAGPVRRHPT